MGAPTRSSPTSGEKSTPGSGRRPLVGTGRRGPGGMTLVELATALGVLSVVVALGFSALADVRDRLASAAALDDLHAVLRSARQESSVRSAPVVVRLVTEGKGEQATLRYETLLVPEYLRGVPIILPEGEEEDDERWLARGTLPGTLFLTEPSVDAPVPAPFDTLVDATACSFCDSETDAIQIVYLSENDLALGQTPDAHPRGGAFAIGRWLTPQARIEGLQPYERHVFVLLGSTGSMQRFVR